MSDSGLRTATELASLLKQDDTARVLHVSRRTLERWRHNGIGPLFLYVDGRVVYRRSDLSEWIERHPVAPEART